MYLLALSCNVFRREMYAAAARSKNKIDLEFLSQGLHNLPSSGMRGRMQEAIDAIGEPYDAVVLGYGLCNNGLMGIVASNCPLVIPKAHDCITMFLGSKDRYMDYFNANPGTYFKTSGWIERPERPEELSQLSISQTSGMNSTYDDLVAKYGEDNARFLYQTLVENTHYYSKFAYINMGFEPNDMWEHVVREDAKKRSWEFERVEGDMGLIQRLLDGEWDDESFLVVPKGKRIIPTHDDAVLGVGEVK